jgi:hypothetical protein
VSDGKLDVEDDLPYTIAFRVNNVMVTMVVDLKEAWDLNWLLVVERKKLETRKKGA